MSAQRRNEVLRAVASGVPGIVELGVNENIPDRELIVTVTFCNQHGHPRKFHDRMPHPGSDADIENVISSLNHRIGRHGG